MNVVLLDLSLSDSWSIETVSRTLEAVPEVPIVVLTGPTLEVEYASASQLNREFARLFGQPPR